MNYAITHDITNEVDIKHKKHIRILIISAFVFLIYLIGSGAEADEAFEGTMTSVSLESADIKKTA